MFLQWCRQNPSQPYPRMTGEHTLTILEGFAGLVDSNWLLWLVVACSKA